LDDSGKNCTYIVKDVCEWIKVFRPSVSEPFLVFDDSKYPIYGGLLDKSPIFELGDQL
jgi:hypothetical protein